MTYCPQCRRPMAESRPGHPERLCPQCQEADELDPRAWASAARVSNLAEAGYLVSLLESEGVSARLLESPSFDAASGVWRNQYLLQVEQEEIERVRPLLHSEAAEADSEDPAWGEPDDEEPDPMVVWRPVALMALAGVATLWYGATHWAEQRPPRPEQSISDLAIAMDHIDQPFVAVDGEGNLVHRLSYQSRHQCWVLESDTDGDGRFDRLRRYNARQRGPQHRAKEIAAWRN